MVTKFVLVAALVIVLFFASSALASGDLSVGVKSGDWIEYSVSSTGAPLKGHDVIWARMDIIGVQGTNISVSITSRFSDNSTDTTNSILNLQTGHLIDDFIIPANLNVGDTFVDENLGNVTIESATTHQYAGATRTVLTSTVGNNTYVWDQATGVSVEGTSQTATYTIHTVVEDTSMWQPQPTPTQSVDFASIILVVAVAIIVLAVALAATARYLRRKASERHLPAS
jgi:hypothetical protein